MITLNLLEITITEMMDTARINIAILPNSGTVTDLLINLDPRMGLGRNNYPKVLIQKQLDESTGIQLPFWR